jgi:hypothetical protein
MPSIDSFHATGYGLVSQSTVEAMAKKMAKSKVGKSLRPDQLAAPNVLPQRATPSHRTVPNHGERTPTQPPGERISSWL